MPAKIERRLMTQEELENSEAPVMTVPEFKMYEIMHLDSIPGCSYEVQTDGTFKLNICTEVELTRYLKGIFSNKERFVDKFFAIPFEKINFMINGDNESEGVWEGIIAYHDESEITYSYSPKTPELQAWLEHYNLINRELNKIPVFLNFDMGPVYKLYDTLIDLFDTVEPFSYIEAFKIENETFRSLVFSSISIRDMIENLDGKRIKTDGKTVTLRTYSHEGEYLGDETNDNIYEIYEMDASKLLPEDNDRDSDKIYAVRCWCTTTNKEHWLWIDEQYKDNPLKAIASTFRIHDNLVPYVSCIKRQGDVLMIELTEDVKPKGEPRPLTSEEYFGWLKAQS